MDIQAFRHALTALALALVIPFSFPKSAEAGAEKGTAGGIRADLPPTGLSEDDWGQIRRVMGEAVHHVATAPRAANRARGHRAFVEEARIEGHGGEPTPTATIASVAVFGDTAIVGAPLEEAAYVFVRSGSIWSQQQKLVAADGVPGDFFGQAVSLSYDTAVVGAIYHDALGQEDTGAAYVFVRSGTTWTQQQELVAGDAGEYDELGTSVSITVDTAVVGARWADVAGVVDAGAAYVFVRSGTTWTQQQKLVASDAGAGDQFGNSVSVAGDTAVVGAWVDSTPLLGAGSAYVFVRSGTVWSQQQKLLAADSAPGDGFGESVAVSGNTAVVGALHDDTPAGEDAGSAYVFVRSGTVWTEQQKLLASDGTPADCFGVSVAVSGDTAVVGAHLSSPDSAYVFVRSGAIWSQQQKLVGEGGFFGSSVSVSGDTAIVGALGAGAAYAFSRSGAAWSLQQKLLRLDSATNDGFGSSVSVSGGTVVVGATGDDTSGGADAGSAYVFVKSGTTWTEQQKLTAQDGWANAAFGYSVSVSGDTLLVGAPSANTVAGLGAGSAYVFVRSGTRWSLQQKLAASDAAAYASFGISASLSGETALVGAHGANAAYVFVRSGTVWSEQQKLTAVEAGQDEFGSSVSLSGDTALVGAHLHDTIHQNVGSAYVFVRSGTVWAEQGELLASDGASGDNFGQSVSLSGDTAVVGAPYQVTAAGNNAGSTYVFHRTGTVWTEQQKLLAPDGAAGDTFGSAVSTMGDVALVGAWRRSTPGAQNRGAAYVFARSGFTWSQLQELTASDGVALDEFGYSVAVSDTTTLVGAPGRDTSGGPDAGSVYVFGPSSADLSLSKTDGQASAVPGQRVTYTIIVANAGPDPAPGATVTDGLPPSLTSATWNCVGSPGAACSASGSGSIDDNVTLPVSGTVTYSLTATIDPAATGTLANSATVVPPAGSTDPNPGNESATDTDTLIPRADLRVTKTDGQGQANPGGIVTYTIVTSNPGPSDAPGSMVGDTFPGWITGVTWSCSASGGASCPAAGGSGNIGHAVILPAGGAATFVASGTVDPGATGTLVNTATVATPGGVTDPEPSDNTATDVDNLTLVGLSDLVHGVARVRSLESTGPGAPENLFRLRQEPRSSYELVVDGVTGDVASPAGSGPTLQRLAADASTVLQTAVAAGAGSSRSLRFENPSAVAREDEFVRVRSAGCTLACGPEDVYRIRAWDTTLRAPRFNNSGTQVTILVLQNSMSGTTHGHVYFWSNAGDLVGSYPFTVGPGASLALDTSTVAGVAGASGSVTVSHDGQYGGLIGKVVAVEPATGFTFDTLLRSR